MFAQHRDIYERIFRENGSQPQVVRMAQALTAFRHLVETYFHLGGMEIQFNVISRETLLAAKKAPQDHRDLLVRVSGFSAYFVDLDAVTQDEIIARIEHSTLLPLAAEQ
jgi:formate C-acetyltransferase